MQRKINHEDAETWATLLPDADLLIAATALSNDSMLITGDIQFERLRKFGLSMALLE